MSSSGSEHKSGGSVLHGSTKASRPAILRIQRWCRTILTTISDRRGEP